VDPRNKPTRACVEASLAREVLRVEMQFTAAAGPSL
jgi:enamine deaminase RidA (YjgF/YER057c/UK114 family)